VGDVSLYSYLTMKKLFTLFVFASLITSARPLQPTLALSCQSSCSAGTSFTFSGDNYSPHKDYLIYGTSSTNGNPVEVTPIVNADGSMSTVPVLLYAGDWTFTVYVVNHNGKPTRVIECITETFN
jgi:hypothetical protein